jgi:hypothetical protein
MLLSHLNEDTRIYVLSQLDSFSLLDVCYSNQTMYHLCQTNNILKQKLKSHFQKLKQATERVDSYHEFFRLKLITHDLSLNKVNDLLMLVNSTQKYYYKENYQIETFIILQRQSYCEILMLSQYLYGRTMLQTHYKLTSAECHLFLTYLFYYDYIDNVIATNT